MKSTKTAGRTSKLTKSPHLSIIGLVLLVVLIGIVLILSGCAQVEKEDEPQVININEYLVVDMMGYDGYGSVSIGLDYASMFDTVPVANDTKAKATAMSETFDLFVAEYEDSYSLKNGDSVSIQWKKNEEVLINLESALDVKFLYDDFTHIIDGLEAVQDYDPFVDLYINTNKSSSGVGELVLCIHCEVNGPDIIWNVAHDGENGKLKNGDVLNLTITDDIDMEAFTRSTGLRVIKTTDQFEVWCLGDYATDGIILKNIGEKEELVFNQVINDWVVSGLNDENILAEDRTYDLEGYMFYTNADQVPDEDDTNIEENDELENEEVVAERVVEPTESMLFAIYKIDDGYVDGGYYVFIGLKGIFSFDNNGVYINHGESLPTSFIYYEKETVRYSSKFGWGQNYEPMGFLYSGIAYAGHRDIQETFNYIEATYGKDYEHRFVSDWYMEIVPDRNTEE